MPLLSATRWPISRRLLPQERSPLAWAAPVLLSPRPRSSPFTCARHARLSAPLRLPPTARLTRAQIPMALTWARVAAIPALCVTQLAFPLSAHPVASALLFAAASFTDFLDGYLARRWHAESELGVFLDPVADKLLVAVALTMVTARLRAPIVALAAAAILTREIFVSALREWMARLGLEATVKVSVWGKVKTAVQMVAVTLLLSVRNSEGKVAALGMAALCLAALLGLFSASEYVMSAVRAYKGRRTA